MALANATIVIGAGLIGTALTRDENLPDITRLFWGAFRIVTKNLQQDKDNNRSSGNTQKDYLLAQVNTLREELQGFASSRPITIVTGAGSGSGKYHVAAVIIVGTLGYVYIWWKGWKISDMMFVTRRGFSDACNRVGKKLDLVSSSVTVAKQQLSSRIDQVDSNLDECKELAVATRCDVSHLHGDVSAIYTEVESVRHFMGTLETKIAQIEGTQVVEKAEQARKKKLMAEKMEQARKKELLAEKMEQARKNELLAEKMEQARKKELIQDSGSSSQRAIELLQASPILSRESSLPPLSVESASTSRSSSVASPSLSTSPASSHSGPKVLRSSISVSTYGLKGLEGIANPTKSVILKSKMISRSSLDGTPESTSSIVSNETAEPSYAPSNGTAESTTNSTASNGATESTTNSTASNGTTESTTNSTASNETTESTTNSTASNGTTESTTNSTASHGTTESTTNSTASNRTTESTTNSTASRGTTESTTNSTASNGTTESANSTVSASAWSTWKFPRLFRGASVLLK